MEERTAAVRGMRKRDVRVEVLCGDGRLPEPGGKAWFCESLRGIDGGFTDDVVLKGAFKDEAAALRKSGRPRCGE